MAAILTWLSPLGQAKTPAVANEDLFRRSAEANVQAWIGEYKTGAEQNRQVEMVKEHALRQVLRQARPELHLGEPRHVSGVASPSQLLKMVP